MNWPWPLLLPTVDWMVKNSNAHICFDYSGRHRRNFHIEFGIPTLLSLTILHFWRDTDFGMAEQYAYQILQIVTFLTEHDDASFM